MRISHKKGANQAAPGHGAITSLVHADSLARAVPEQHRWLPPDARCTT
jgi:hypothetical protein